MHRQQPELPDSFKEEYPFDSTFIDLEAGRLHYIDEGEGEPILMLHGNPTWSFFYRDVVKRLRGNFRCIVPDHIGCGLSDKPQDYTYRLQDHIANTQALIKHLGLTRYRLIVHDWGGAIGMGVAVNSPESIEQIVVLNTGAFLSPHIPWRINLCRTPVLGELLIRGLNAFAGAATRMAVTQPLSSIVKAGFIFPYNNWHNRIATHRFVKDIPMASDHVSHPTLLAIDERLKLLSDKPMLICWGEKDFCFNHYFLEEWEKRFPQATVKRFSQAGHYVLEDAGDRALQTIVNFLNV